MGAFALEGGEVGRNVVGEAPGCGLLHGSGLAALRVGQGGGQGDPLAKRGIVKGSQMVNEDVGLDMLDAKLVDEGGDARWLTRLGQGPFDLGRSTPGGTTSTDRRQPKDHWQEIELAEGGAPLSLCLTVLPFSRFRPAARRANREIL